MATGAEQIVIVGGGPAGLASARAYRRHGGRASIVVVGEEPDAPYRRPPLSKEFLRGEVEADELAIEPPRWFADNDVRLRLGDPVIGIDPALGTVNVTGEVLRADAIVLATGSEPIREGIAGLEHPDVMTMRTLADSRRLGAHTRPGTSVLVLGSGFVGCEVAASLALRGAAVTLVGDEPLPQARRLGEDVARRIAGWLRELGVRLALGVEVTAVHDGRALELGEGPTLTAELLVLGLGARPRGALAERAGLALSGGAVCVDAHMRAPGGAGRVLAVGDVAAAENAAAGRRLRVEHWGDALAHGEVAGSTLAGADASWDEVPGFWSTIGRHTIKYAAWGDGYEEARLVDHGDGAFTVWYRGEDRILTGVLTHARDADYELGRELIGACAVAP